MVSSKLRKQHILLIVAMCFLASIGKWNQAIATKIEIEKFSCWVCQTEFSGPVVYSWNYNVSGPYNMKPLKCPRCGAPPKRSIKPQIGLVRDLMAIYLEPNGDRNFTKRIVKYCINDNDVDAWEKLILEIDYDSLIVWLRDFYKEKENDLIKDFDAVDLLSAIDTAKRLKGQSESSERLKRIEMSKVYKGKDYWGAIRALIEADPSLLEDAIYVTRQQAEEEVAKTEKFKIVREGQEFQKDLLLIMAEVKRQINDEKQKFLLQIKE